MKKFILLTLAFGSWVMLQSQDVKQDFNTNSISIFKNGTAFFIKSGQVDPAEGVYTMKKNLPPAFGDLNTKQPPIDQDTNTLSLISSDTTK